MKQKYIFTNYQSPGDLVMLTATIRDLHKNYPNQFITDVRSSCPALWENNPWLTPLDEDDPTVTVLPMSYPLINQSNQLPYHFIHGFTDFLNQALNLNIKPTAFKGDIHLSEQEKQWMSQVEEITHNKKPFWIIVAGGKFDFTAKWWSLERYQAVVDHFQDKIQFVQVGQLEHNHPALNNVLDLRGQTDLRQLIRLVHHSSGILCPVTLLMHLAAAVPPAPTSPPLRPCVVVAGGREGTQWEAYPNHQYIHTVGALPCCAQGGCWKSRVLPLGDGDEKDLPDNLCVNPVDFLPKCMDMISAQEVIRRIAIYFEGGILNYET